MHKFGEYRENNPEKTQNNNVFQLQAQILSQNDIVDSENTVKDHEAEETERQID